MACVPYRRCNRLFPARLDVGDDDSTTDIGMSIQDRSSLFLVGSLRDWMQEVRRPVCYPFCLVLGLSKDEP